MTARTLSVLMMAAFSSMIGMGVISPFLPGFAKEHGANGFWLGMIFAGFGLSRMVIMPFVGRVSDRIGRKVFVAAGLALYTVVSMLYPRADNVKELTAIRMIHGLAVGMIIPIVMAYMGDLAEKGKEGLRAGTLNMMFYTGLAAGPILGGLICELYGFAAVFHAMTALGAFAFLVVLIFLPALKGEGTQAEVPPFNFHSLIRYSLIKTVLISAVAIALMVSVFMSFLPSLAARINIDLYHIGLIISVGIFLAGLFQIPFGRLSDRLDRTGKMIQVGIGISVGMLALFVMPFCPDFHMLITAGAILGIGAAISAPALMSVSIGIGRESGMGAWMGVFNTAMSVGMAITPLIAGIVMDLLGIDCVFYLFGILAAFIILGSIHFFRRRLFKLN